ncbi:hypothetical protein C2G38_2169213 [Gigaspora rosea]|uniref:Uncharacterized protein n=1 Tax=Gigaspora rosea TaxID=44941 RepID=A0A397VR22_9GLOM|nr:hypothetical protein C2G38_2169213 [Gigaspora rosea]
MLLDMLVVGVEFAEFESHTMSNIRGWCSGLTSLKHRIVEIKTVLESSLALLKRQIIGLEHRTLFSYVELCWNVEPILFSFVDLAMLNFVGMQIRTRVLMMQGTKEKVEVYANKYRIETIEKEVDTAIREIYEELEIYLNETKLQKIWSETVLSQLEWTT